MEELWLYVTGPVVLESLTEFGYSVLAKICLFMTCLFCMSLKVLTLIFKGIFKGIDFLSHNCWLSFAALHFCCFKLLID